ncbi:hypothetical protein [Devosia sp.]|uniref:hypothetical protein n=1 Tax=Devosia sp. TaxID=1871048 RepID=UPI001AC53B67|nr:hypothetical protein [Devosia sp.]MBN9335765.1 hypothetical protein [Devosia sp.]
MSTTANMLADCGIVIFAPNEASAGVLGILAMRLGFGSVAKYTELADQPQDRLTYFLIHGQVPDATKHRIIQGVRSSDSVYRRFAPIICFVTNGPRHQIVPLVQMGFDDVLFASDDFVDMTHKLHEQLRHDILYVETQHYIGPDRRRIERIDPNDSRRHFGSDCRKIRVVRDPRLGITVEDVV